MNEGKDIVIIPDLHGRTFWREAVNGREDNRIIFLGDYLDPYTREQISPDEAYRELLDILEFKKAHMGNVVLLLGNHDLGYLDRDISECRMDYPHESRNRNPFLNNLELFEMAHVEELDGGKKVLFTHAGIREAWVERHAWLFGAGTFDPATLNTLLHQNGARRKLFITLADASVIRGGTEEAGSAVWADIDEYMLYGDFLPGYIHVFGHSQHDGGPVLIDGKGWCLDCRTAFAMDREGKVENLLP